MIYDDTDAFWLAFITTALKLALSELREGRGAAAELVLTKALEAFSKSPCSKGMVET